LPLGEDQQLGALAWFGSPQNPLELGPLTALARQVSQKSKHHNNSNHIEFGAVLDEARVKRAARGGRASAFRAATMPVMD
jgi:hypothetical protein